MRSKTSILSTVIITATLSFMILSGCSSQVALTPALLREYKLSDQDIKKLQLYISDGLLLEQENTRVDKDIDSTHALKTVEDNYVKQIFFKKKTPCIAVEVKPDRLAVAFEPEDRLTFDLKSSRYVFVPDKKIREGAAPKRVARSGYDNWSIIGTEQYRDSAYNVLVWKDAPYLLADQKGLKKLVVDRRAVKGMRQTGE
jgi:hypothetical protein